MFTNPRTGQQLTEYKDVLRVQESLPGFEPGDGQDSKTKQVHAHIVAVGDANIVVCDTPGFGDTEGSDRDVANSIATSGTIRACASVRICVVVDQRLIENSRGTHLKTLLSLCRRFVTDEHLDSVLMVFTHCVGKPAWRLQQQMLDLQSADHIQQDRGLSRFMGHIIDQLDNFDETLMLHPDRDIPDQLMKILMANVPPIENPGSVLKSPISPQAEAELVSSLRSMEAKLVQLLKQHKLQSEDCVGTVEVVSTISKALMIDSVSAIRGRCANTIADYCAQSIGNVKANLDLRKIALARSFFDRLAGYRGFIEFVGDRGEDIHASYNALIGEVNTLTKQLADIDDCIEHSLPNFDEILDKLDVLRSIGQTGPDSLQPFLIDNTRNLYGTAVEKVQRLVQCVFDAAMLKVHTKQLDAELDVLLDCLAQSMRLNDHIGHNCCVMRI